MVGIVVKHGTHVVIATGQTLEVAEHIALELFGTIGLELEGESVTMMVFDPADQGGMIFNADEDFEAPPDPMAGWGPEGFTG